jgi:DNA modification methylase
MIHALPTQKVPIESIKPYRDNPRRGSIATIRESLEVNGQYRPIVVRKGTKEILAGNHTWAAARELGWTEITVSFVSVNDEQARRIVLVDNRSNDVAGYDYEELLELIRSLPDLDGTGYDLDGVAEILAELEDEPADGKTDPDDVPEPAAPAVTKPGDVWELGDHRLMCGDATDLGTLRQLVGGQDVDLIWTDPPYNVDYEGGSGMTIQNDALEADEFGLLLERAMTAAIDVARAGAPIYIAHAETTRIPFQVAMLKAGWLHKQTLIWAKNTFTLGRQDYQWQHEPILYGWKPGAAHRWFGEFDKATVVDDEVDVATLDKRQLQALVRDLRNERNSTVIREDKPSRSEFHPTTKPVRLVQHCVRNSSQRGDRVLDPFSGSGSTLIAAETLGRQALALELDPVYCDVIVKRWQAFTGKEPKRGGKTVKALT